MLRRADRAPSPNVVLVSLLSAGLVFSLVQTFVTPALPALADAYDAEPGQVSWVLTAFLLASSVATPLLGRVGDLYGRARVLVIVLLVFALGCAISALAPSIELVILGRVVQGAAGGIFPLSFGILRETLEPRRVPGAIGLFSAMFGIGGALGLPLSGVVVDHLGVAYLFWIGLLALPAAFAVRRVAAQPLVRQKVRIDWLGAVVLSISLFVLLLGLSQANRWGWVSPPTLGMLAAGLLGLGLWTQVEQRVPEPVVELRLLRYRPVLMANTAGLLVGFSMFSGFLLLPQLLQAPDDVFGFGLTLTAAGLVLLPSALVQVVLAPFAGVLARRVSSRFPLLVGAAAIVTSFVLLALAEDDLAHIVIAWSVLGIGLAFSMASMANVVVESVPRGDVGVATGINQISRTIGGALGTQVSAAILTAHIAAGAQWPAERGFTIAFLVAGGTGLLAFAAALAIPRRRGGEAEGPGEPALPGSSTG